MSTEPLITIITPSYNQAEYLEYTIRSVLNQNYPQIEYIIVDGGSTDNSLEVIKRYQASLAWWTSEPDAGQAEAINKGLQGSSGEYIAWLNSDDLFLPGAIAHAVDILKQDADLGMVFGDAITIDALGKPLNNLRFGNWGLIDLASFRMICQPAVFFRRSVLQKSGLLDTNYHFLLDHQLWIRIALNTKIQHANHGTSGSGNGHPSNWAAARHHKGAKNVAHASRFSEEALMLLNWMESHPDLAPLIAAHKKKVFAGAYRLSARYSLDGGKPGQALKFYWRAMLFSPPYTLKHWHRILYACAFILAGEKFAQSISHRVAPKPRPIIDVPLFYNWPGLNFGSNIAEESHVG